MYNLYSNFPVEDPVGRDISQKPRTRKTVKMYKMEQNT